MTTHRLLIADDEPLARERLRRMVSALPDVEVCGEAANGDEVLTGIRQLEPDILLLDIRMPGKDGLEVASLVQALANPPAIIFCTAYDHYAIRAFDVQAIAYLLKPVRQEALAEALARAGRVNRVQRQALQTPAANEDLILAVTNSRGTERIDMTRVYFCEADQKYVTLTHDSGETLTDLSLKALEQRFPGLFLRLHRNTLAGTRHIRALERNDDSGYHVRLEGHPATLPVSRRHLAAVRQWLTNGHTN
ncbi:LytTR family DNA-binding domain-containing protein [uncultured Marinobacter sp.]|uniref:LytR/AlgR family response regulator transcription factor n=1 Tax=uncultured Marinobacter sp. TaxID=187379 RepID=UPI0030DAB2FE